MSTEDWLRGLCPELTEWQIELIVDYTNEAVTAEREACAEVCDELHWPWHMGDNSGPKECAAAIRARGNDD